MEHRENVSVVTESLTVLPLARDAFGFLRTGDLHISATTPKTHAPVESLCVTRPEPFRTVVSVDEPEATTDRRERRPQHPQRCPLLLELTRAAPIPTMPELPGALPQLNGVLTTSPEVERARRLIAESCTGYIIGKAETYEDTIVYDGATHDEFVSRQGDRCGADKHRQRRLKDER